MNLVRTHNIKHVLYECFATDQQLLDKFHVAAGSGLEGCVKRTMDDFSSCEHLQFYKIMDGKTLVGYAGKEIHSEFGSFLTGFFIKPSYRSRPHVKEFWKLVKALMNDGCFFVALHTHNTRAINFIEKAGAERVKEYENEQNVLYYLN